MSGIKKIVGGSKSRGNSRLDSSMGGFGSQTMPS